MYYYLIFLQNCILIYKYYISGYSRRNLNHTRDLNEKEGKLFH